MESFYTLSIAFRFVLKKLRWVYLFSVLLEVQITKKYYNILIFARFGVCLVLFDPEHIPYPDFQPSKICIQSGQDAPYPNSANGESMKLLFADPDRCC
jgi:hypothetical protein